LILKGPLSVADRLFQRMFDKIGDDATRDIAATVTRLGNTRT